jgi:hypothetical protein
VIDGFSHNGIELDAAGCLVTADYIGTNPAGSAASANGADGVLVQGNAGNWAASANNTIGGAAVADRNVISGNAGDGVHLFFSLGDVIQGNYIGTNAAGTAAVGNGNYGVDSYNAANVTLGGIGAGNVISGNGIGVIAGNASGWLVQGNLVGTNAAGTAAVGNNSFGLRIDGAGTNNTIGGTVASAANVIAGNATDGVEVSGPYGNVVEGNYIGTNSAGAHLGNGRNGVILFAGANNNLVGGSSAGTGNIVAYNGAAGVAVGFLYDTNVGVVNNAILGNSIHDNAGPGIVLSTSAANNNQAAPVLTAAYTTSGTTIVVGTITSTPNATFRAEFFANPAGDPEGQALLGSASVTTDSAGHGSFTAVLSAPLPAGQGLVTATATDPNGNTSPFSAGVTATPLSSLSGTVFEDFNDDGQVDFGEKGISGVTVTLAGTDFLGNPVNLSQQTDSDGAYVFLNLLPGTYTITETQPAGYAQGIDSVGTAGGSLAATDQFRVSLAAGVNGENYNFGEQPGGSGPVNKGQTAGIGFWNNKNGQALILALNGGGGSHQLGDWLAATLPHMFGANSGGNSLAGKSNASVAALFQSDFVVKGVKLDAQVLATALAVYATNATLDNTAVAANYGFVVSGNGVGARTWNVGSAGDAFGVANNTTMTVMDLLLATDSQAINGLLYNGNATKRNEANAVYSALNQAGSIS